MNVTPEFLQLSFRDNYHGYLEGNKSICINDKKINIPVYGKEEIKANKVVTFFYLLSPTHS